VSHATATISYPVGDKGLGATIDITLVPMDVWSASGQRPAVHVTITAACDAPAWAAEAACQAAAAMIKGHKPPAPPPAHPDTFVVHS
jgi:hypothetical protein